MITLLGLVAKVVWHPQTHAADILCACFDAYLNGATVHSDSSVLHTSHGFLNASFGRQMGHTTAVCQFSERTELDTLIITDSYEYHYSAEAINIRRLDAMRGRSPELVFVDVSFQNFLRHLTDLMAHLAALQVCGTTVITTISDGVDTTAWFDPVCIEIGGPARNFSALECVGYDIEPAYQSQIEGE